MQTINLDLAMNGLVSKLHAKQNDVGKKVAVVLTDNGAAYSIPGDAVFSVWYSGASGEGNYTTIDGRSAFSVSGNTVTVELILQMLQNKGPGQLCLVMNKADGTQLGLWNIPYSVEELPGAGSQEATAYYTAFLEAVQNAKSVGIESTEYPGCFYRMYGTEKVWINPPMVTAEEYRTTEYYGQYPVWTSRQFGRVDYGTGGRGYFDTNIESAGVSVIEVRRGYPDRFTYSAYANPATGKIMVSADGLQEQDLNGVSVNVQLWYTKNTDTPTGGFG